MSNQIKTLPPGNLGLSSLGDSLDFIRDNGGFAAKRHAQYGPVFKTRLFGQPMVFVRGAEANRFILSQENQSVRVDWPFSVKALLGRRSLALQAGDVQKQRRKLMAQAFQSRALEGYMPTMYAIGERYFERWCQVRTLSWYPELRKYTFDIAGKLLIGLDHAAETDLGHWFEEWCGGLFSLLPLRLPGNRFNRAYRCREQLLYGIEQLLTTAPRAAKSGARCSGHFARG
nr:cytochrome P450 [Romeria gracilis]